MRGFFAFGLSAPFSTELKILADSFPASAGLTPMMAADYHVTIKFLSEFSSTEFFACLEELRLIGPPPPNALTAGKIALWPTVLALECAPTEELISWHGRVNALLKKKGFLRERHPRFRPHITMARRKAGREIPEVEAHLPSVRDTFAGRQIPLEPPALWRSEHEASGRRHHPLLSPLFVKN